MTVSLFILVNIVIVGIVMWGMGYRLWVARSRRRLRIETIRASLSRPGRSSRFKPAEVESLPDPARRFFLHAFCPGTPLPASVELDMEGTIQLRPTSNPTPFIARELLAPPHGFLWEADVGKAPMILTGADSYHEGTGRVEFFLKGIVPLVVAFGADVSRSSQGRLVLESFWLPSSLLPRNGVTWEAVDEATAKATMIIDGNPIAMNLTVDTEGRLLTIVGARWGKAPGGTLFSEMTFRARMIEERTFGHITIPTRVVAGWEYANGQSFEFFHCRILTARF